METANLPSVVGLGLKQSNQLEQCKNFVSTQYTVDVGQSLFTKPLKPENSCLDVDQVPSDAVKLETESDFDYDIEYSAENVPLGEILERLQTEPDKFESVESDKSSNLIRLHAANDSTNNATISATLNFATLDLSSGHGSLQTSIQSQLSEINDVLFSIASRPEPLVISTSSPGSALTSSSLSSPPSAVPDVNTMFCASPSPASSDTESGVKSGLLTQSPPPLPIILNSDKTSPQECNICNKLFGNASALAKHRLTHSDERKYLCTVCHKAFKRQDHLNGHLLTHRNKKPFECTAPGCNKSYCDARSLRRHRENHHSNNKDNNTATTTAEVRMMVSPASSITSSDLDDTKSLGSESCDGGSIKQGTKLVFTGLGGGDVLKHDKLKLTCSDPGQLTLIEQLLRESKDGEARIQVKTPGTVTVVSGHQRAPVSRISVSSAPVSSGQYQKVVTSGASTVIHRSSVSKPDSGDPSQNMVECSICARKFKNIPALNGHMRLHGGYYRKDNDKQKQQQQQHQSEPTTPKLVTTSQQQQETLSSTHRVSSNVISLIEEKIIQKRKLEPAQYPGSPPPITLLSPPKFTFLTSSPVSSSLSCSMSSPSSTSSSSTVVTPVQLEPPQKRLALEASPGNIINNSKSVSSFDNLVFPVLPQPDTDKLLANLHAKHQQHQQQTHLSALLPDAPQHLQPALPSVPLPDRRPSTTGSCSTTSTLSSLLSSSPVNIISKESSPVKSSHPHTLLKIDCQRTDFQPSIGHQFQAELPECGPRTDLARYELVPSETLMWSPVLDKFPETQLEAFLKLASSSGVKDSGNPVETALYTLLQCNGNIIRATQRLLGLVKLEDSLSVSKLRSWTAEEVDMFYESLCKHKKDFSKIADEIPNKSSKECVEFYYLWKNICREEAQSFKSIINDNSEEGSEILAI